MSPHMPKNQYLPHLEAIVTPLRMHEMRFMRNRSKAPLHLLLQFELTSTALWEEQICPQVGYLQSVLPSHFLLPGNLVGLSIQVPLSLFNVAWFSHWHAPLLFQEIILFCAWEPLKCTMSVITSSPTFARPLEQPANQRALILQLLPRSWLQLEMSPLIKAITIWSYPQSILQMPINVTV